MRSILADSRGFTLIEMLVVVAILGAIMGAMSLTLNTVFLSYDVGVNQSVAIRQVEQAGYYLSKDVQMAYSVNTTEPFVSMYCYTGVTADTIQTVSYTLSNNQLSRNDGLSTTVVARYLDDTKTSITAGDNNTYIINVTAIYPFSSGVTQNGTFRVQQRAP
jgi:prepilin-type N-terminal cleavage/methylation domain-containing protein